MSRRSREGFGGPIQTWAGWLFADMLLALAILFLIANTVELPKPPTESSQKTIESNYCLIRLYIADPIRVSVTAQVR